MKYTIRQGAACVLVHEEPMRRALEAYMNNQDTKDKSGYLTETCRRVRSADYAKLFVWETSGIREIQCSFAYHPDYLTR